MSSPPPSSSPVPASSIRRSARHKAVSNPAQPSSPSSPKRKGPNQETGSRKTLRSDTNASPGTSAAIPTAPRAGIPASSSAPCGLKGKGTTPPLSEIVNFIVTRFLPSTHPDVFGEGSNMGDSATFCAKMIAGVNGYFQGSVAFTDVLPIFGDFTEESEDIPIFSSRSTPASGTPPSVDALNLRGTTEALAERLRDHQTFVTQADAFLASPMWQIPNSHTLHGNEAAARMLIDTVVQHALDIGQRLVASVEKLDEDICERYGLKMVKVEINNIDASTASWMLLHPEVRIDSQKIDGTELQLHGALDYTVEVVQTDDVAGLVNSGRPLKQQAIYGNRRLSKRSTMSIMEAKADSTFIDKKTTPQVVSQGVAEICRSGTKRRSIVNVLTDGAIWQFYHIRRTSLYDQPGANDNVKRKPFTYSCTPAFTIEDPNNLAIVCKLIVAATLGHPDDFAELARII